MKIGIIDFNPDQNPDRREYVKRIKSLLPDGVDAEGIVFYNVSKLSEYNALILSGSRLSMFEYQNMIKNNTLTKEYQQIDNVINLLKHYNKPVLGICFGAQALAYAFGGELGQLEKTEAGYLEHELTDFGKNDYIFSQLPEKFYALHMHRDYVKVLPRINDIKNSEVLATRNGFIHAYKFELNNGVVNYGVQPHPEMSTKENVKFLLEVNKDSIITELGSDYYNNIMEKPDDADFEFAKIISLFVNNLENE